MNALVGQCSKLFLTVMQASYTNGEDHGNGSYWRYCGGCTCAGVIRFEVQ